MGFLGVICISKPPMLLRYFGFPDDTTQDRTIGVLINVMAGLTYGLLGIYLRYVGGNVDTMVMALYGCAWKCIPFAAMSLLVT